MAKKREKTPGVEAQADRWTINLPPVYREQVNKLKPITRRTLVQEVCLALEKHLAEFDLWPPAEEGQEEDS